MAIDVPRPPAEQLGVARHRRSRSLTTIAIWEIASGRPSRPPATDSALCLPLTSLLLRSSRFGVNSQRLVGRQLELGEAPRLPSSTKRSRSPVASSTVSSLRRRTRRSEARPARPTSSSCPVRLASSSVTPPSSRRSASTASSSGAPPASHLRIAEPRSPAPSASTWKSGNADPAEPGKGSGSGGSVSPWITPRQPTVSKSRPAAGPLPP